MTRLLFKEIQDKRIETLIRALRDVHLGMFDAYGAPDSSKYVSLRFGLSLQDAVREVFNSYVEAIEGVVQQTFPMVGVKLDLNPQPHFQPIPPEKARLEIEMLRFEPGGFTLFKQSFLENPTIFIPVEFVLPMEYDSILNLGQYSTLQLFPDGKWDYELGVDRYGNRNAKTTPLIQKLCAQFNAQRTRMEVTVIKGLYHALMHVMQYLEYKAGSDKYEDRPTGEFDGIVQSNKKQASYFENADEVEAYAYQYAQWLNADGIKPEQVTPAYMHRYMTMKQPYVAKFYLEHEHLEAARSTLLLMIQHFLTEFNR